MWNVAVSRVIFRYVCRNHFCAHRGSEHEWRTRFWYSTRVSVKTGRSSCSEQEQVAANVICRQWIAVNSCPQNLHHSPICQHRERGFYPGSCVKMKFPTFVVVQTYPWTHFITWALPHSSSSFAGYNSLNRCYIWAPCGRKYDARGQSRAVHAAKEASRAPRAEAGF